MTALLSPDLDMEVRMDSVTITDQTGAKQSRVRVLDACDPKRYGVEVSYQDGQVILAAAHFDEKDPVKAAPAGTIIPLVLGPAELDTLIGALTKARQAL